MAKPISSSGLTEGEKRGKRASRVEAGFSRPFWTTGGKREGRKRRQRGPY